MFGGNMQSLRKISLLFVLAYGATGMTFAAQHESHSIHKRLAPVSEEEIKEAGEDVPLLNIRIEEPEESKQRPVKTSLVRNVKNYLALHGQAAQERLRKLKYPILGVATNATIATLCALPTLYFFTDILTPNFPAPGFCPEGMTTCTPCPEGMVEGEKYCEGERWKGTLCLLTAAGPAAGLALYSFSRNYAFGQLKQAIIAGDVQKVKNVLATKLIDANPIEQSNERLTPLIIAAQHGQGAIAGLLLEEGADASLKDAQGKDALDYSQFAATKKNVITDSPALQQGKLAVRKAILEHKMKKREQARLRGLYEPTEVLAAASIEALHTSMYGKSGIGQAEDISSIVGSYLTPEYVHIPRTR